MNNDAVIDGLHKFYQSKAEPTKSCLLALRSILLKQDAEVSETMKWQMPCFTYKNKMFCFLWTDKKTTLPYLLFVEGKHLVHSALEIGDRTRMKVFNIDPNEDIPIDLLKGIINTALDLYRNGIIKIK